jgi:uncharacterized OB-fold protein
MNPLPTPAPMVTTTTKEFWSGTARGEFLLQQCTACDLVIWFPRSHCPECATTDLPTFRASGKGVVYSHTVIRKVGNEYKDAVPFVVAYVELDEGPRIMTNIVECDPNEVKVGMRVEMVFHDTGAGSALYRFRPSTGD